MKPQISRLAQLQIDSLFEAFEDIVNLTEKDFNSFGYVKSPEHLKVEADWKKECNSDTADVSSAAFDEWQYAHWTKLEAYAANIKTIFDKALESKDPSC